MEEWDGGSALWALDTPYTHLGGRLPARERSGQPEPWEHAGVEARDGADPVAGEREDQEAGPMADPGRATQVRAERRLTVSSRRHEVESSARADHARVEPSHDIEALVLEGERRHREEDVVREQG